MILSELLKNSRVSDRQIAKKLGVSQPTVSRRRLGLEKTLVEGYTAVPKLKEMGFEIMAFTFVASRSEALTREGSEQAQRKAREWLLRHPNVIFFGNGQGMGWSGVMVSVHRSYSDYLRFKAEHNEELGEYLADAQSFIMELDPNTALKPFNLSYLADFNWHAVDPP